MICRHVLPPLAGLAVLLLIGCAPKYPKCDRDEHCKSGEVCVNGLCQQCRTDPDCPSGQRCNKGRCEKQTCKTDKDCPSGLKCADGRCVACRSDADCPQGQECQGGACVAPPRAATGAGPCTLPTIYFDFDEHVLTAEATQLMKGPIADCLKRAKRKVRLEGHCDARGTEEYNLALGERRAQSVKRYLERLGFSSGLRTVSKGKLESTGTDETGWAQDRRVQFHWE